MDGSKPVAVYKLVGSEKQKNLMHALSDKLTAEGWKWFSDFYIEWATETIELQIYREELIPTVKEFIVEESI